MAEPIISVSGLRGTIGDQLTPAVAVRYVAALAATLPAGSVVVARDGRSSGRMLADVIRGTLVAHGLEVIDLDVSATPTVGIQVRHHQAVAGVQISASHNPKEYNGLKLFGPDGRVLPKIAGERVLAGYRESQSKWVGVDELGSTRLEPDGHHVHLQSVLKTIDAVVVRQKQFKVLLDSNHGAGSILGRHLLDQLGCVATTLGDTPDGRFEHPPEPLEGNLTKISQQVRDGGYDVGFCQDPDADRLAVIDEQGRYIGEELTVALCLLQALPQRPGTVVINCASSSVSEWIARQHGSKVLRSAVGEANVADLMLAEKAVFGGEGSGGPIDPQVGYVRDSFVGMARILHLMATTGLRISQIVDQLPPLAMVKDKATLDSGLLPELWKRLPNALPGAQLSRLDGLRLEWPDRWLLVRGSNTEPIVRFIAEGPSTEVAAELCLVARKLAESLA